MGLIWCELGRSYERVSEKISDNHHFKYLSGFIEWYIYFFHFNVYFSSYFHNINNFAEKVEISYVTAITSYRNYNHHNIIQHKRK